MLKHMPNDELKHLAKHYFLVNKSFCLYHKTEHRVIVEFQLKKNERILSDRTTNFHR